ncbi:AAA family ATPase [Siccibacter turicensis]|uniref:AAA family ATPase n=1 Tax=Siccibacter turicensis TaxID=357233 RepID=UPI003F559E69
MTITRLAWHALKPDTDSFAEVFTTSETHSDDVDFSSLQPRLCYGLEQLHQPAASSSWMLVKALEAPDYLTLITQLARQAAPAVGLENIGGRYVIEGQQITLQPALSADDDFAPRGEVVSADWIESEQLFGCVRQFGVTLSLQPGLIHRANGGTLVLALRSVLAQPLLWLRLKQMVIQRRFDWLPADESRPLPVAIPSLPLSLKVILVGDRESLADFQEMESMLAEQAIYSEYEDTLQIDDDSDMTQWVGWVTASARASQLPVPAEDSWPVLIHEAVRYTGDRQTLPLCPVWLLRQLREVAAFTEDAQFTAAQLEEMLATREWREGYLAERMQDEILLDQILIETEGERVGQINALSVVEFPGHPRAFGEPSRISCVVHIGDGEFVDIERKAELGGNIHAKGMMIMQAFLMTELQLEQQIPFSASLTFEQSYSEVDGDSASMAELCTLISALAEVPVSQNVAITGSVDQFGRAQPVGGLNEKIEGFFAVCDARGLNGQQGVIVPAANVRHLCLQRNVLEAVKEEKFFIWAVEDVRDALPLLTTLPWDGEGETTLLQAIQERIAQATQHDARMRPWPLRWLNWFNHN